MTTNLEERAREFLSPYFDMLDDLRAAKMNRDAHEVRLAASYAQVQAEARLAALEEAAQEAKKYGLGHEGDSIAAAIRRLKFPPLAQAAAPAKETK